MGRLILDTSALVASERGLVPLDELIADGDDVAISAVTVSELLVGVGLAEGRRRRAREASFREGGASGACVARSARRRRCGRPTVPRLLRRASGSHRPDRD